MEMLEQLLKKIKSNKAQRIFLFRLMMSFVGVSGKRTMRNCARYAGMTEHTIARQMKKEFDFLELNTEIIKEVPKGRHRIAAQDATHITKAGSETHGVDFYWKGTAGRAEKGLEIDVISVIEIGEKKTASTLSAKQTPANPIPKKERSKKKKPTEKTRIDFYVEHVKSAIYKLIELGIRYMTIDSFGAKEKYVTGVISLGLHVISKLRKDARLRRLYTGKQKTRGRKRKFDTGRIDATDFVNLLIIKILEQNIELTSCIGYSVSLKRQIKIVRVRKLESNGNYCDAFLFSTDLAQDTFEIYEFYTARFQIEFIFRDAKNFTGLNDCQSRDAQRLHYHFNASLTALNLVKLQDIQSQKNQNKSIPFSMTNYARQYHTEIVINRFISMFDLDPTLIKLHPQYKNFLEFANVKH